MKVIALLEYELAYYDPAVHRFNPYTMRTPPLISLEKIWTPPSSYGLNILQPFFYKDGFRIK